MKTVQARILKTFSIVTAVLMPLVLVSEASTHAQRTAKIKGVVSDQQDAVVVRARIRIESRLAKRTVESDDFGRFEVDVPFGYYDITIESSGFEKLLLTEFQVTTEVSPGLIIRLEPLPTLGHPYFPDQEHIERINAPVPGKIGPRKIQ